MLNSTILTKPNISSKIFTRDIDIVTLSADRSQRLLYHQTKFTVATHLKMTTPVHCLYFNVCSGIVWVTASGYLKCPILSADLS